MSGASKNRGFIFGAIGAVAVILVVVYTVPLNVPAEKPKTLRVLADSFFKVKVGEDAPFFGAAKGGVEPYHYEWDFGDGTTLQLRNATHVYTQPGNYTVTLTVTDAAGTVQDVAHTVQVFPPDANFTRADDILRR